MCALCQLPATHEAERLIIANYIDPGNGYVVQSMLPMILGILSTIFASVMFYFRRFFKYFKKRVIFIILAILVIGIIGFGMFQFSSSKNTPGKRVVVLGFDGMDPKLLEKGIANDELPNFKKLSEKGTFAALDTSLPPQSPVAWASFATGDNPNKHTVYDFIIRHPKNYELELTFSSKDQIKSKPFWEITTEKDIPIEVLFLPNTFPAGKIAGKMLTGMGTPDITGTQGTAHLISSKSYEGKNMQTKVITVENLDDIETTLSGPRVKSLSEIKPVTVPLHILRDEEAKKVTLTVDGKEYTIAEKKLSEWIPVTFSIDFFTKQKGLVQFYVKEVAPDIELYVSPIIMDPRDPVKPISYPSSFGKSLVEQYGLYSTLGLPHDTGALNDGIFDDAAFLAHIEQVTKERERIFFGELKQFNGGIFIGYFGFTDTISHMFWRYQTDPVTGETTGGEEVTKWYKRADAILGKTMRQLKKDDILVVMSDHGFSSYDYDMNLNSWLRDNGYLTLKDGKETGGALLEDVDWTNTKAYAIGYNGIYLNLKGREGKGIVNAKDAKKLEKEIKEKLLLLTNPLNDEKVVKRIYLRDEIGIKSSDENAPDIFVGFYKGIRPSSDAAIGIVGKDSITKRVSTWTGDHLYDPSEVPGVFVSNRKVTKKELHLVDLMPTMLAQFMDITSLHVDGENLIQK